MEGLFEEVRWASRVESEAWGSDDKAGFKVAEGKLFELVATMGTTRCMERAIQPRLHTREVLGKHLPNPDGNAKL